MNANPEALVSLAIADLDESSLIGDFPEGRRLIGTKCSDCETTMIGSRVVCSNCVSRNVERVALPTTGSLYSYTRIRVGVDGGVKPLGYVDLDGVGVRTLADLREGAGEFVPDMRVQLGTDGDDWFFEFTAAA